MAPTIAKPFTSTAAAAARRYRPRFLGRWWRRQSPSRQDRFVTLGPLLSVLMFLCAIILSFWYLRAEETAREQEAIVRDTSVAQHGVRIRIIENQELIQTLASDLIMRMADDEDFGGMAAEASRLRPEITQLQWIDDQRLIKNVQYTSAFLVRPGTTVMDPAVRQLGSAEATAAFDRMRQTGGPAYSRPYTNSAGTPLLALVVPMMDQGQFKGAVLGEFALDVLLRQQVPAHLHRQYMFDLVDGGGKVAVHLGGEADQGLHRLFVPIRHDVAILPSGEDLFLRAELQRTSAGLVGNTLFWLVTALSLLTLWMLIGTWNHMRRRTQIQSALVKEANFRRAMENSMLTGMRAMDLNGRITYVNPAFCAMTGFSEAELLGEAPPYPHWPNDRVEENKRILEQELQGRSPAGGIEVRAKRKDGSQFDARMYVSPLIDPNGTQTGWMTSMTDITETKRVRDQLTAAHERFTTVLEGLDAAVSVIAIPQGELLFANRSYRLWFGGDANAHMLLADGATQTSDGSVETELISTEPAPLDLLPEDLAEAASAVWKQRIPSTQELLEHPEIWTQPQQLLHRPPEAREFFLESEGRWFDVRTRFLPWTDGRLAQMLIATDVTDRHLAQAQAAIQAEKAQVASRLVTMGEMASSVAHELNQPLTAISNYCTGMLSRIQSGSLSETDMVTALEKTAKQAQRAGQIIHRIRNFVRRAEPQRQNTHPADIVENVLELAGIEMRRRRVTLQTYLAKRLPGVNVDPILIEQVLLNLIKNAGEAIDNAGMPPGQRRIELRVIPKHSTGDGHQVEFTITDNGPGLKEEVLQRLFEAFFTTKTDGMGIGLSLCRSIIESHQGRLKAENLYNGALITGCRFSFVLPATGPVENA